MAISHLKIAIIHDTLIDFGGGEKVLRALIGIFPSADVYTSYVNKQALYRTNLQFKGELHTSWLQHVPLRFENKRRLIQILAPFIWLSFNLKKYDIVITHGGFYFAQFAQLKANKNAAHIHYCISPAKNVYGYHVLSRLDRILNWFWYPILKLVDHHAISSIDCLIAVSQDVKQRIKETYGRNAQVVYPLTEMFPKSQSWSTKKSFCYIGRLSKEKNLKLIIDAFNQTGLPLQIVGEGPEGEKLKKIAHANISFTGYQDKRNITQIILSSYASIHAAVADDFPLSLIESLALGTPVIALQSGGAQEMIIPHRTGLFFVDQSSQSLIEALRLFQQQKWSHKNCRLQADSFCQLSFNRRFHSVVVSEYGKISSQYVNLPKH